jgi:hypothetical protein
MNLKGNGKLARLPNRLGEEGESNHHRRGGVPGRTDSQLLIRRTVFGGRGRFRIPPMALTAEVQFVTSLYDSARRTVMLRVVAPYVAEMLHLKLLIINCLAGVAGFLNMSSLSDILFRHGWLRALTRRSLPISTGCRKR